MPSRAFAFLLCASLAAPAVAFAGCDGAPAALPPSASHPRLGTAVPDFSRRTLDGGKIDTASSRGSVLVVKFFAKYCAPCKKTLPAAQKLSQAHEDVQWVGVSVDEYASDAQELVQTYGLTFPIIHDQGRALTGRYGVSEMPVTFVVDRAGVVQWVGGPGQDESALRDAIAFVRAGG
jgi:peroxiredoxin